MMDAVHTIAFLLALVFPLAATVVVVAKKWWKAGAVLLLAYVTIYFLLSLNGQYSITNHGGNDWRRAWMPKGLVCEYTSPAGRTKEELTLAGAAFWPCIVADRILWHRTTDVSSNLHQVL
jgi:hypothetical protein